MTSLWVEGKVVGRGLMWPMNYMLSERQDMMDGGHEPGGIDGIRGEFSHDWGW